MVKAAERGGLTFWSKLWFTMVFDFLVKALCWSNDDLTKQTVTARFI
jgi:hypothetical protein